MIAIGRYDQAPRDNKLCPTWGSNQIENKIHFLFQCPTYITLKRLVLQQNTILLPEYQTIIYNRNYE